MANRFPDAYATRMKWLKHLILLIVIIVVAVPMTTRIAASLREAKPLEAVLPDDGQLIETAMGRIFVMERGPADGQLLLLAHGTAAWSGLWEETLVALGDAGFRAVAFDMPPFGYSDRADDGDYSRATSATRLNALAATFDEKPILIAHSFGAGPGVEAVMRHQDAYAGLVIVDGAIGLHLDASKAMPALLRPRLLREAGVSATVTNPLMMRMLLASMMHVKEAATDARAALLNRPMVREGTTSEIANWLPALLAYPNGSLSMDKTQYQSLTLPVSIIWGDMDSVTPLAQGQELQTLIPDSNMTILDGVGHIPQIEAPAAFQEALLAALKGMEIPN